MSKETNRVIEVYKELEREAPELPFTALAIMAVGVYYKGKDEIVEELAACEEALRQAEGEIMTLRQNRENEQ